ncbi:MAG: MATE family efflux transporter [Deltaproteobacteria bacterium]|nr:MATE family efflux transporter [Deltaproteobacteria bacterium]
MDDPYDLTARPIPQLIMKLAVPSSVGFFFNTMFNVVDTYFGGLISTQTLAALSLSLSVFFMIIAIGTGIGAGTTALIANALGEGDRTGAKLIAVQGITFGVLLSLVITAVGLWSSPFLFSLLGASGSYLNDALIYMDCIFVGTIFFIINYMLNAILNALGDTKSFRNFLMAGFVLNCALDPWLIYGGLSVPALGLAGIALATVLIQFLGCLYLGVRVWRTGLISDKRIKDIVPQPGPFRDIALQGFPAGIHMGTMGIGFFVITYFAALFGKEAVAAYGIAIPLLPTIGLNVATLAIVAHNNGAGLWDRIHQTLSTALRYGAVTMALGAVAVFAAAGPVMGLFTGDPLVIAIGTTYLRIAAFILYAYVILFVHVAALQGVKRPLFAIWIGLIRQIVLPVIVFYVLTSVISSTIVGIWWGIFGITWGAAIFTVVYVRRRLRAVESQQGARDS